MRIPYRDKAAIIGLNDGMEIVVPLSSHRFFFDAVSIGVEFDNPTVNSTVIPGLHVAVVGIGRTHDDITALFEFFDGICLLISSAAVCFFPLNDRRIPRRCRRFHIAGREHEGHDRKKNPRASKFTLHLEKPPLQNKTDAVSPQGPPRPSHLAYLQKNYSDINLPAACCLLPAACCLLPAACCLLPARGEMFTKRGCVGHDDRLISFNCLCILWTNSFTSASWSTSSFILSTLLFYRKISAVLSTN
ncbi:MAG: hypothetical protein LBP21_03100, partial [Synergistaceae bacterium]|nr:hypothetical protein [Synergistaceae bacterium]